MFRSLLVTGGVLFLVISFSEAKENWPQFRGGNSSGVADDPRLPEAWDEKENVVWANDIPGRGWSSPVVWGDRIFLTAVINEQGREPKKGLYTADVFGKLPPGEQRWVVYCLDLNTGKILWERVAHQGKAETPIHLKNTHASETSVTDGERVYAYFGNLGLFCYDREGELLWTRKFGTYKMRLGWGTGSSPTLHKGRIYILHDNEEKSFLAAIDARSGEEVWRTPRDEKSSWTTPFVWENTLRTEIITAASRKVRSYDLNGELLWELGSMSSIAIPTPSAQGDVLYVSSGYVGDFLRRPVYAIKPGASGDISLKEDQTSNEYIIWSQKFGGAYHPSQLVYGDFLYVLHDQGFLACYDAKTGKEVYGKQRMPAPAFTASPWASNGKIFCLSEDGETFVVRAGPKFELLGRNPLNEMTLATPAIAGDSLILRTAGKVYRIARKAERN